MSLVAHDGPPRSENTFSRMVSVLLHEISSSPTFKEHSVSLLSLVLLLVTLRVLPPDVFHSITAIGSTHEELAQPDEKVLKLHQILQSLPADTQVHISQVDDSGEQLYFVELKLLNGDDYSILFTFRQLRELDQLIQDSKNHRPTTAPNRFFAINSDRLR